MDDMAVNLANEIIGLARSILLIQSKFPCITDAEERKMNRNNSRIEKITEKLLEHFDYNESKMELVKNYIKCNS